MTGGPAQVRQPMMGAQQPTMMPGSGMVAQPAGGFMQPTMMHTTQNVQGVQLDPFGAL